MPDHEAHSADHSHAPPTGDAVLRARGRRLTRQRRMIWEALAAEPDRHLSAAEVTERVRARVPRVTPSTVYRTLDVLVEAGLALRTDLGGDRVFYEPAREHPHHHLVCERCGAVRHVHDDVLGDLRGRIDAGPGMRSRRARSRCSGSARTAAARGSSELASQLQPGCVRFAPGRSRPPRRRREQRCAQRRSPANRSCE